MFKKLQQLKKEKGDKSLEKEKKEDPLPTPEKIESLCFSPSEPTKHISLTFHTAPTTPISSDESNQEFAGEDEVEEEGLVFAEERLHGRPVIKGGNIEKLVERLTYHKYNGSLFGQTQKTNPIK
jgi:hypothetical protein